MPVGRPSLGPDAAPLAHTRSDHLLSLNSHLSRASQAPRGRPPTQQPLPNANFQSGPLAHKSCHVLQ
eukprot:10875517-Alexandrium_andersonii.AAC.1